MLCSKCQETIHPVVVLDIDGTLGDYHGHFHDFTEAYTGHAQRQGYDGSCELHEWYGMSLDRYRDIKLAYRQGGMKRSMPCYHYAKTLVSYLRAVGVEVWIATTRPYLRLDNIDPDTREWLRRNRISYDGLLYSENKYERLLEIVHPHRIVAVVDDLPEMCTAAYHRIGENVPLLIEAQHNYYYRELDRQRREANDVQSFQQAKNLHQVLQIIQARLDNWRRCDG